MSKFFPGQFMRVRINGTTLAVMVRAVGPFADEPHEADLAVQTSATNTVSSGWGWVSADAVGESGGGPGRPYPPAPPNLDTIIERSRVDALERRADTRDTALNEVQLTLGKVEASINDVFRQLAGIRSRVRAEELEGCECDRRLDALETARAWIDTQEVKARMDKHNERLDVLERRIAGQIDSASVYRRLNRIESALTLPILTTKPKE